MSSRSALTLALAALIASSGCTSFEIARLRNTIDRDVSEVDIGEGYAMSFGRFTMGTARTVLALSDDDDESTLMVRAMLRHVKKVQIGRYDVHGIAELTNVPTPRIFDAYERGGWMTVATVREPDEIIWVMAKEKREDLRDLLVVVLSSDELMVAKLSGNLSRGVAAAMAESDWPTQLARSLDTPPDSATVDSLTPPDAFRP